jgi:hypothetical protein
VADIGDELLEHLVSTSGVVVGLARMSGDANWLVPGRSVPFKNLEGSGQAGPSWISIESVDVDSSGMCSKEAWSHIAVVAWKFPRLKLVVDVYIQMDRSVACQCQNTDGR